MLRAIPLESGISNIFQCWRTSRTTRIILNVKKSVVLFRNSGVVMASAVVIPFHVSNSLHFKASDIVTEHNKICVCSKEYFMQGKINNF